jgi:hypothetical protein
VCHFPLCTFFFVKGILGMKEKLVSARLEM